MQLIGVVSITFWFIETLFFLIRDGWHWKAITRDEQACDDLVGLGLSVTLWLFFWITFDIIQMFSTANVTNVTYEVTTTVTNKEA